MKSQAVLSIAGSDPSGGAGIQADLKTFTTLGVYGGAVITCLTVQNTQKVFDALFLPGAFVRAQIQAVLDDIDIGFIKIGMLGNGEIARSVGEAVRGRYLICDPVMISKSGYPLMDEASMQVIADEVIAHSTILTPNYHELMKLSGNQFADPLEAGEFLLKKYEGLQALLVKGGHISEDKSVIVDTLLLKQKKLISQTKYSHRRIQTKNTHGTGCTLSSAITAYLARGEGISAAVDDAICFVSGLIEQAEKFNIGKGNGSLPHHLTVQQEK